MANSTFYGEIDESANVAWLKTCREHELDSADDDLRLIFKLAFSIGFACGADVAFNAAKDSLAKLGAK